MIDSTMGLAILLLLLAGATVAARHGAPGDDPDEHRALAARLASRDPDALSALYDQYGRMLFSLAFRILGRQGDAEDVVQEVFAQAWRQADRYDPARGAPGAWLVALARSRAIDRLRAERTRAGSVGSPDALPDPPDVASTGPEAASIARERADRVRQALAALPGVQRIALELAYFEGLSHSEIAARLEQPLGTVKTRIRLGLLRLRQAMETPA
jgi:RNA polymerase sigma-70 factor (ECF subfamily)